METPVLPHFHLGPQATSLLHISQLAGWGPPVVCPTSEPPFTGLHSDLGHGETWGPQCCCLHLEVAPWQTLHLPGCMASE